MQPTLSGHEIRSVHLSPRGYLAVAAIDGLLVARMDGDLHARDVHWFDSGNGFTAIEPLMGPMAESEDGTLWLAGLEEVTSFRPENLLFDSQQSTQGPDGSQTVMKLSKNGMDFLLGRLLEQ